MDNNKKTFCCDRFKANYENGQVYEGNKLIKEIYPNIKIIKLAQNKFNEGEILYRFLFVCGLVKDKPPVINMKHCPFCGTNLFDFYKSDNYVNGKEENFNL